MGRLRALAIVALLSLGLLTVLTVPGAAQQPPARLPQGAIYVPSPEGISVYEGESLEIGPNTSLTGPGAVNVWGNLTVKGEPGATANFSVPIFLHPGGRIDVQHAHLWLVNGTALHLTGGTARLTNVLFEANSRAIFADGDAVLAARDSVFRDHAGEAVYVEERADVVLERVDVRGNGRGVTVYSATRFDLNDSTFEDNSQHLVVDLGPWSAQGEISLHRNTFRAPAATPAQLPGILLRHDPPLVDESAQRTVRLDSNRLEGAPVALRAEGRGLVVLSANDTLVDNGIGLSVQLATVRVDGGTFGNDRDVDGSGRVSLNGVTYLRPGALGVAGEGALPSWVPWALGGAVLLVGIAAFLVPRLARPRPAPSPQPLARIVSDPEPPRPPAPPPAPPAADLGAPLTTVERRILEDILANPGTAQRAVADRLGMTRQALHYHVKKLEARGLVLKVVEGRETRCNVPAAVASMLSAPVTQTGSEEKA